MFVALFLFNLFLVALSMSGTFVYCQDGKNVPTLCWLAATALFVTTLVTQAYLWPQ